MGVPEANPHMGGRHVMELAPKICDPWTCPNMVKRPNGYWGHKDPLGGNHIRFSRMKKYRVPEKLIRYLCDFPDPDSVANVRSELEKWRMTALKEVRFCDEVDDEVLDFQAREIVRFSENFQPLILSIAL